MSPDADLAPPPSADGFGSTAWSLVIAASRPDETGVALDRLCRKYWRPVYVFIRRRGLAPSDAEDATQEFFIYLLDRDWIKQADPLRGSFRGFLLALVRNFLANYRRRQNAFKRTGPRLDFSFETTQCEPELEELASAEIDAALAYDRIWAHCLLQAAMERLAGEQAEVGKEALFETLRPFIRQPAETGDYAALGRQLGFSRGQVALLIHRLSRRFAELIRIELAETLVDRTGVEGELRHLLNSLPA
jgi:RNA polymerase sigma factor (sigma-70 family)